VLVVPPPVEPAPPPVPKPPTQVPATLQFSPMPHWVHE
jgi:hypothetical protein